MVLGPDQERNRRRMDFQTNVEEERRGEQQREKVCWINSRKPCPPELARRGIAAGIGIDKNESRKNKKEIHTDVSDRRYAMKYPGAACDFHSVHMENAHVQRGEKAHRGQGRKTGAFNHDR